MRLARWILGFVIGGSAGAARAEVTLAPLFTNGAVLQRDKPVAIWGWAGAGERITVGFAGQRCATTTPGDGRWIVLLEPLAASSQGAELVVAGRNTVTVRDVVVGEVWLCAGQSRVVRLRRSAGEGEPEVARAHLPLLRQIAIERTVAGAPAERVKTSGWQGAGPAGAGFSAAGDFFARELHQKLGVPVGLVVTAGDGAPIEAWLSPAGLRGDPQFAVVGQRWQETPTEFPPAGLFNGMINPLLPYGLRGALWFPGESDGPRAGEHHALFTALITSWRAHFGQGDFPFYWVSPGRRAVPGDAGEKGRTWALLREAQARALALPHTGQALAIDLGDPKEERRANQTEVGRRLALLAKNRVYGIVGDDTGPTMAGAVGETRPNGTKALRVRFTHADGLVAHEKPPQALEVAGADRVFHPAEGRIEGDTLLVWSARVREPLAVRYAFTNSPEANLHNGAGLPAVPFRTDDW